MSINGQDHNSNFLGDLVKKGGDAITGFMNKAKKDVNGVLHLGDVQLDHGDVGTYNSAGADTQTHEVDALNGSELNFKLMNLDNLDNLDDVLMYLAKR